MIGWVDFIAGWVGGVAGLIVGHPFDTVKVRQQILHTTLFDAIKKTFLHEGFHGFYKGMLSPVLMTGPSNAVFFGIYGNCMRIIQNTDDGQRIDLKDPKWKSHVFWSGCIAGSVQVLVNAPMELVKTMLQMQTNNQHWKGEHDHRFKGIWDCLKHIYKANGILGMYRGTTPMLFRDIPTSGIYTLVYEVLLHHTYGFEALNVLLVKQTIAGGISGICSWIPIIPFDVVKSRLQADDQSNPKYKGMWDCIQKSYKESGLKIFMKGGTAMTVRAFPANAAIFVGYEYALDIMEKIKRKFL